MAASDVSSPWTWRTTVVSIFGLSMVGVLMMGAGATAAWITVGIPNEPSHTAIRGTDLTDGMIVLTCAIVALIAAASARPSVTHRTRLAGWLVACAGMTSIVSGSAFLIDGRNRDVIIRALAVPRDIWPQVGAFRDVSVGPYLAVVGGLLCLFVGARTTFAPSSSSRPSSRAIAPPPNPDRQYRR
jgi:hypothetical protein